MNLKDVSQTCGHLLYTTGGKLEMPKFSQYTLERDFTEYNTPFKKINVLLTCPLGTSGLK